MLNELFHSSTFLASLPANLNLRSQGPGLAEALTEGEWALTS